MPASISRGDGERLGLEIYSDRLDFRTYRRYLAALGAAGLSTVAHQYTGHRTLMRQADEVLASALAGTCPIYHALGLQVVRYPDEAGDISVVTAGVVVPTVSWQWEIDTWHRHAAIKANADFVEQGWQARFGCPE